MAENAHILTDLALTVDRIKLAHNSLKQHSPRKTHVPLSQPNPDHGELGSTTPDSPIRGDREPRPRNRHDLRDSRTHTVGSRPQPGLPGRPLRRSRRRLVFHRHDDPGGCAQAARRRQGEHPMDRSRLGHAATHCPRRRSRLVRAFPARRRKYAYTNRPVVPTLLTRTEFY